MPNAAAPANDDRRYSVHARHDDRHQARVVTEPSFEAAAVAFLETHPVAPDDDNEVSVVVRDLDSGHEHCFRVDIDTGETQPCG